MKRNREALVTAFALFSLFFGAGNLILPPQLGFKSGDLWWLVTLGFCISAVLVPILGILAHARLQGTMFDFGRKVSPAFSLVYCYLVYAISIALPSPRTASVTHEMAVQPFFSSSPLITSIIYFFLVFIFVVNRSRILDLVGKWLSPGILLILILIIGLSSFHFEADFETSTMAMPFTHGILEGYQTFDAIGAVVVGGVILVSINLKKEEGSYGGKKKLISKAAWLAGAALFLVYSGLILTGALVQPVFDAGISRTALLSGIGYITLGVTANAFLSLLVGLACFTTAVGIVTGTADFVKSRFPGVPWSYRLTALGGCALGVLMGRFEVGYIIDVALPALMFIYPLTITLILLNVIPERYASPLVFKTVVATTLFFSVPDFLGSVGWEDLLGDARQYIPLSNYSMGWVLPGFVVFLVVNTLRTSSKASSKANSK